METRHFDFVVIGGGSAGFAAARTARESLEKVAIIDDADELGGLCILRGCMPSKTLIYSTEVLHLAQHGEIFGLTIPRAALDMAALHKRKLAVIEDFASYRRGQLESERFTLIRDRASFTDEKTVVLEKSGERISADFFMIATGSVVNTPDIPGLRETPHWTSDEVLELDFLPESVVVLGGGIVACELAQFLRRAGSRVVQVQRGERILRDSSAEAAAVVSRVFLDEGIELHTGTTIKSVRQDGGGVCVEFSQGGQNFQVHAAHLFNAMGRSPNVGGLALQKAGVEICEAGSIRVNDMQQTSNPHVYAGGDVASPQEIVHLAVMQGEVAAKHACGKQPEAVNYDTVTGVTFTDPQIATAGISLEEAGKREMDVVEADYPFDDHGKSILMEAKHGHVKAWADRKSGKVIGAECVGKDAGELIHAMAVAISLEATPAALLKVHWYHPTLSEIWSYPLEDLADALRTND